MEETQRRPRTWRGLGALESVRLLACVKDKQTGMSLVASGAKESTFIQFCCYMTLLQSI